MNKRRRLARRLPVYAVSCVILMLRPGYTSEPAASIELQPRIAGPVNIADLRVLLGDKLNFQMFDFESDDDFCLYVGYEHDHNGRRIQARAGNQICNLAGRHRFVVTMRRGEDIHFMSVAVHDLDVGMGSTGTSPMSIPASFTGWTNFRNTESLIAGREVTVVRWIYAVGQPGTSTRSEHEVRIKVRLGDNPEGKVQMIWGS